MVVEEYGYTYAKRDNFWRIYAIIVLLLACVFFGYGKFEENKVRWANETVKEVQRIYNAQQQNWIKAQAGYVAQINKLEGKNAKK